MGAGLGKESLANLTGTGSYHCAMIGLDQSGKTTILYRLKFGQYTNTVPTIGFNCEKVKFGRFSCSLSKCLCVCQYRYLQTGVAFLIGREGGGGLLLECVYLYVFNDFDMTYSFFLFYLFIVGSLGPGVSLKHSKLKYIFTIFIKRTINRLLKYFATFRNL